MKVLKVNEYLLKWIGFPGFERITGRKRIFVKFQHYIDLISPFMLLGPSLAYFVGHVENVVEATAALYMIGIISMTACTFTCNNLHHVEINSIFNDLQLIVDESMFCS